jgi:outer membrane protein
VKSAASMCAALFPLVFATGPVAAQQGGETLPPTGQQAMVPKPAAPPERADRPLRASPSIATIWAAQVSRPLTIDDAVSIALAVSPSLASAAEAVMQAHGATTQARSARGPTASVSYGLTRNNEAQVANLGGQSLVIQKQYTSQVLGSVGLPLDVTGALRAATSQAQFQELAARADVDRVRSQVVLDVRRAFYEVLRRQALVMVAETNVRSAETQVADAQVRLSVGTVTRLDVLSAQAVLSAAQQGLRQNRSALSQALAALRNTMGVDVSTPIQLTTEGAVELPASGATSAPSGIGAETGRPAEQAIPSIAPGQHLGDQGAAQAGKLQSFVVSDPVPLGAEYDTLLREALTSRPEIAREDASVAAARKGVYVARSGAWPGLSLSYSQAYNPDASGLSSQTLTGYTLLSVNLPILDAGATRGRVQQARARVSAAETGRRTQVDAVTLEVRQTWLDLRQYLGQVGAARQELAQADEAYRLAQGRYSAGLTAQAGISPLIELSSAQKALIQAQSDYVNALYDYNAGRSALDKAVGRYAAQR